MDTVNDFDIVLDINLVEIINIINRERKVYAPRPHINNYELWDDKEFIQRFRLSKNSVQELLLQIEQDLMHTSER